MRFSIIVPCYNERENLDNLVKNIISLQKKELEYILVENGSEDGSKDFFKHNIEGKYANIKVVYVDKNKGYGYGLQQGLKNASGEYVGWIHADLQVSVKELIPFLDYLEKEKEIRNYFLKGERKNRSLWDRFFTVGMGLYESILFGTKLYDVAGFPVVFNRSLLKWAEDIPNDFLIELYFYYLASKHAFIIHRIPVQVVERKYGSSKWRKGAWSKIRSSLQVIKGSVIMRKQLCYKKKKGQ